MLVLILYIILWAKQICVINKLHITVYNILCTLLHNTKIKDIFVLDNFTLFIRGVAKPFMDARDLPTTVKKQAGAEPGHIWLSVVSCQLCILSRWVKLSVKFVQPNLRNVFVLVLTFYCDLNLGSLLTFWGHNGLFSGLG